MAESDRDVRPHSPGDYEQPGEVFRREGPEPPAEGTGETVDEMNEIAREAVLRHIRPEPDDEAADTEDPGDRGTT